jgi:sugar phosphate isomerase/epimerase
MKKKIVSSFWRKFMIGLQLYTVRDALKADYEGTIRKIAAMGYEGVETAGEYNGAPETAKALFDELGLKVSSMHGVIHTGATPDSVLETLKALGTDTFVCAWAAAENFESEESLKAFCGQLNAFDDALRAQGAKLAYHNHAHELKPLPDGSLPFVRMVDFLNPSVLFEVDTYWVQVGGANVLEVLKAFGDRAPLLHIKDGPGIAGKNPTAVGDGVMDVPSIVEAHKGKADWLIVELDACDTDMMEAVQKSYSYLSGLTPVKG